jgi:nucleotidyltransferase substrate binding protein (TIGR01987 family)
MSGDRARSLAQLGAALDRLEEALREPRTNPLWLDGTIQRFKFGIELTWKVLKIQLAREGTETATPKETMRRAYQAGWLDDETTWLKLLHARNLSSHTYDEGLAMQVYEAARQGLPAMRRLHEHLSLRVREY